MSINDPSSSALLWLFLGLLCLVTVPAEGQMLRSHSPDRITVGQDVTLYLDWEGNASFEGGVLSLPEGWSVESATLLGRLGRSLDVRVRATGGLGNQYMIMPANPAAGPRYLAVIASAAQWAGSARWTFVPYRASEPGNYRLIPDMSAVVDRTLIVTESPRGDNYALSLGAEGDALVLDGGRLPDVSSTSAFTAEAWIRTTRADQVVLSTWDGDEGTPYSMELIVDATGRAVFFQGIRGDHRTIRSLGRVADGAWHHVAVTHDPERGWTHLLLDGVSEDSLYHASPLRTGRPERLVLGGRPGEGGGRTLFLGEIDEFRIWEVARTPAMIRSTAFRELAQPVAGGMFFSFDRGQMPDAIASGTRAPRLSLTDLSFTQALSDLTVEMDEGGVTLSWTLLSQRDGELQVERSEDGSSYTRIGTVQAQAGRRLETGESGFSYRDDVAGESVVFYRIRQVRDGAPDLVSNPVKVGRSEALEQPTLAVLEGSFPNPFNPTTTIRYSLVESQDVSVSVWDLSGQLIQTLWSGQQEAGEHTVSFSADNLPSGTYFVRLRSPEGVQSHPILLMK